MNPTFLFCAESPKHSKLFHLLSLQQNQKAALRLDCWKFGRVCLHAPRECAQDFKGNSFLGILGEAEINFAFEFSVSFLLVIWFSVSIQSCSVLNLFPKSNKIKKFFSGASSHVLFPKSKNSQSFSNCCLQQFAEQNQEFS